MAENDNNETESDEVIFRYTAQDAVGDGLFVPVGRVGEYPVYFTSNLFTGGYKDEGKRERLVYRGLELLRQPDPEDSDYLRLRVIEKDRIWVTWTGEGITYMKPEDY